MRAALAVLVLVFALPSLAAEEAIPTGQLPVSAEPLHYSLHFTLDPAADGFQGEARIRVRLHQPADHLWLHGRDLKVAQVQWTGAAGAHGSASYQQRNDDGVARVDFGQVLAAQDLELSFIYSAAYNGLEGVFKVKRGSDNYLLTQLEDVAARRAFPGFDQPSYKTPYDLALTVPESAGVVANTRQISDERDVAGLKTLRFATTAPLPTYLVAFAVGPWDVSETLHLPASAVRPHPLSLRVFGPRGSRRMLDYALRTTPAIVTELENYFGREFPFDKLDLLAAPDFAYGAMENAGLIVFREPYLLLDEHAPASTVQDYTLVNTHEIAHQWFGDDVTLRWWDDTWLNESFASWIEGKIVDRLHPEFHAGTRELSTTLSAMADDSLVSARRIREPIVETGDIGMAFDKITYQKGRGVLAMFESWLGEEKFRDGVRLYLKRHAHGSTTADDLLSALSEVSGKGPLLAQAMRTFLDQPGTPYIRTRLSCAGKQPHLSLEQSRYLPLGSRGRQGASWKVPVCVKLGHGATTQTECTLLVRPQQTMELPSCPDWYLPNAGGAGYYRYVMPAAEQARLDTHVGELSTREQMVYADALAAGIRRGDLPPQQLWQALPALAAAPDPDAALAPLAELSWMLDQLADAPHAAAMRKLAAAIYQPVLDRLGYAAAAGEPPDDTRLRQELASFLALRAYSPAARAALLSIGQNLLQASSAQHLALETADPNLLASVLAVLAQEGGEAVVRRYMAELADEHNPARRDALIAALGAVSDPASAALVREYSVSGALHLREMVSLHDAHKQELANRAAYWTWFQANFARATAPFPSFAQGRIPRLAASGMCSSSDAAQLKKFLEPRLAQISGGKRALAQQLEAIELCAALRTPRATHQLAAWVDQQNISAAPASLADAVASARRDPAMRARDLYRHPRETLEFFGLKPDMTVVEVWPAPGWYAEVLAPWLRGRGHYIAAGYVTGARESPDWRKQDMKDLRARFDAAPDWYGKIGITELGLPDRWNAAPAGSADAVLTFRNVHNWISGGYEKDMFAAFFRALKPGGTLGVVEHRAAPGTPAERIKATGYVTEQQVIALAQAAGFVLAGSSEINANRRDRKDYAEGVWTLPPTLKLDQQDRETYLAIGESDRMTLKFTKPEK